MPADLETRATRMIMNQAGVLRLRMATSQPQYDAEQGVLFKRSVEVPPETSLEKLMSKWNPGVPPETLEDLMTSVCRWNQLESSDAVRPGLKLLIPSVLPHGKEPDLRKPISAADRRPSSAAPPLISPKLAMGQHLAEQRLRAAAAQNAATGQTAGIWATQTPKSPALAGSAVKQQFQASAWPHGRPQQIPFRARA